MALQDLTPQLRTRLSRMERAVGWFVILAMALLLFGFGYYLRHTAERKGWFKIKVPFFTMVKSASGLKVGDPVQMMGFDVGQITHITAMPAEQFDYNVYVEFELKEPYYDYMWTEDSAAKVTTADLLGKRVLEVTRGTGGYPAYVFFPLLDLTNLAEAPSLPEAPKWLVAQELFDPSGTNLIAKAGTPLTNLAVLAAAAPGPIVLMDTRQRRSSMTGVWNLKTARYDAYTEQNKYWLFADESPAVTERLESVVAQVENALPNVLGLTNQLANTLSNVSSLTSNLNVLALNARPAVSNLAAATAHLDQPGALGDWLLPTNLNRQLEHTLGQADSALLTANTNIAALAQDLALSLEHLASLTSNLNSQVQANTNILSEISTAIVHADDLVQGLKRHWLLRSAFRTRATNAPSATPSQPLHSPKEK
jgi:MlaD protein